MPEYSRSENVSLHSFITHPFVPLRPALVPVAEAALTEHLEFVRDDDLRTDWAASGLPQAAGPPAAASHPRRAPPLPRCRQYFNRTGCAFVRVAERGFLWINNRLRVSDVKLSLEQKQQLSTDLLGAFAAHCAHVAAVAQLLESCGSPAWRQGDGAPGERRRARARSSDVGPGMFDYPAEQPADAARASAEMFDATLRRVVAYSRPAPTTRGLAEAAAS